MTEIYKDRILHLDNTYRGLFSCPRKLWLQGIKHIKSTKGSQPLRYGSTWHGFMEGYYSYIKHNGWSAKDKAIANALEYGTKVWDIETAKYDTWIDDYRTFQQCGKAFAQYLTEAIHDEHSMQIIDTETKFCSEMPLSSQETLRYPALASLDKLYFHGRVDLRIKLQGMGWIVDHKTTGQSLGMQAERMYRSAQFLGYSYAAKYFLEFDTEGCFAYFHQLTSRKSKVTEEWGSVTCNFLRQPQIFTDTDYANWRDSFLYTAAKLTECIVANDFPMQFDQCYQYGRCTYLNICQGNIPFKVLDNGDIPEGYQYLVEDLLAGGDDE